MSTYGPEISDMNFKLIGGVTPNATDIKKVQIEQVNLLMNDFKLEIDKQYQPLPADVKNQCGSMYTSMTTGIENYKQEATERINEQELGSIGITEVAETIPLFNMIVKLTPLFISFTVYALLTVISPIMAIIGGFVYGIIRKIKPE